jgi:hypothetical protein
MSTVSESNSADTAITLDLSSLGSSATWVAGQESGEIDNTTNKYLDVMVYVDGITGHASTANVVGDELRVYVWGSRVSLGSTAIGPLDGTHSAETLTATLTQSLKLAAAVQAVVTTAGLVFNILPFSVAGLFGGNMPKFWGIFVTHSFQGALAASNNSLFQYVGKKLDIS